MPQTTDQVLARRRVLLIAFLIGWAAWYGFFVAQQTGLYGNLPPLAGGLAALTGILGWLVFAVAMVKILRFRQRYKDDPEARAALDDELARDQNRRASLFGVYVLIFTQVALVLAGDRLELSAAQGAHVSIFLGVASIMGAALWLDMRE